jgi:hypothetical protein
MDVDVIDRALHRPTHDFFQRKCRGKPAASRGESAAARA